MDKHVRESCPQLIDLIQSDGSRGGNSFGVADRELELRLAPPGEEWQSVDSDLCLGYSSNASKNTATNPCSGAKRGFFESQREVFRRIEEPRFLQLQTKTESGKDLTQKTNGSGEQQGIDRKTSVVSTVVGWPPIRSFRKNLASTSSKPTPESQNGTSDSARKLETSRKTLFVKINMDGIPIGRKVDLKAHGSYEKLSLAVDELFRDLLAAQRDPINGGPQEHTRKNQAITDLIDGSGEYTFVYEDGEGDRVLVGDVPWEIFVSTAKRLRVMKSSALSLEAINKKRTATG